MDNFELDRYDGVALSAVGIGGGWLIFQRSLVREKVDGPTTLLLGAGLMLFGGLSWLFRSSVKTWHKKKD